VEECDKFFAMSEMWKSRHYDKPPSQLLDALGNSRSYIEIVDDELETAITYFKELMDVIPAANRSYEVEWN
jgi:hypothetical protein